MIYSYLSLHLADVETHTYPDLLRTGLIIIHYNSFFSYLNSLEMLGEDDFGLLAAAPGDTYSSC